MSILVQLKQFEGPLGLLLYLIRKEEMDILDVNIHEITRQYLEYIQTMRDLDLELAGDFVAMAATLIHIKSRMLLPQYDDNGEEIVQEDPRRELVQKLLEYQKFQEASQRLSERALLGRDLFVRGAPEDLDALDEEGVEVGDSPLFALISVYRQVLRKVEKNLHQVVSKTQSIASRILEIKTRLVMGARVRLRELLDPVESPRFQLLITFLALLELGKMGYVSLFQSEVYGDIHVDVKKPIERDVISRVEEYDAAQAEKLAESLTSAEAPADAVEIDGAEISPMMTAADQNPEGELAEIELSEEEAAAVDSEIEAELQRELAMGMAAETVDTKSMDSEIVESEVAENSPHAMDTQEEIEE